MPPILIAEATAEAVRLAPLRQRCDAIAAGLPPHQHASADARQAAHALGRTLDMLAILRGDRRREAVRALE